MIDVHTHLHPPKLAQAIHKWFIDKANLDFPHAHDPQSVAAALRKNGVERFVFCSYAHKAGMAKELNQWLAQTARTLDRYGLPLATVHPDDADRVEYFKAALKDGCIGLKIHEDVQRFAIDDPRIEPILKMINEHQGFVLVHVGPIPWKTDTNNGPARLKKVLETHPGLKIVVAHFGVPDSQAYLKLTEAHPNLYLDTTMAMTDTFPLPGNVTKEQVIPHADNIVFGSDFPFMHLDYDAEPRIIRELNLGDTVQRKIFSDNARRILQPHW